MKTAPVFGGKLGHLGENGARCRARDIRLQPITSISPPPLNFAHCPNFWPPSACRRVFDDAWFSQHVPRKLQLTKSEKLALRTLTPRGRRIHVCHALEATTGWDASTPINKLLELKLVKRVKRGHYERTR